MSSWSSPRSSGLPAFLSTTTPLVSARFAARGSDPWWLYAASNAASLGGLLAYPLLIEPRMPLSAQRAGAPRSSACWRRSSCWLLDRGRARPRPAVSPLGGGAASATAAAVWLFAACMPAGLLSATTTLLATDHRLAADAVIGPLGVYLGSFVVAFSARGRRILPSPSASCLQP